MLTIHDNRCIIKCQIVFIGIMFDCVVRMRLAGETQEPTLRLNPDLLPDLLASMQQSQLNQSTATQEMGTGRSVNQLADNPASSAALVRTHDQANQEAQFLQNLTSLQGRFQVADSALGTVTQVLTRALSLGTEGANGTMTAADRQSISEEVQGLLSQTVGLANSTCQGAYLRGNAGKHAAVHVRCGDKCGDVPGKHSEYVGGTIQREFHNRKPAGQPNFSECGWKCDGRAAGSIHCVANRK